MYQAYDDLDSVDKDPRIQPDGVMPVLQVTLDQGTDGWSASYYCLYKLRMAAVFHPGPFHGTWNDARLSCQDVGKGEGYSLWTTVLTTIIPFQINFGPFEGAKWFQEIKDGAQVMYNTTNCNDPLFLQMLPAIARDLGREADMVSPSFAKDSWDDIFHSECFLQKGPRCSTTRWFGWLDSCRYWSKWWHTRRALL